MPDQGLTLNDDGTVDVQLDDGQVVHLPRPKIKQFLALNEAMELGDAQFRVLCERDMPEDLVDAASAMAIADLGIPSGSAKARGEQQAAIATRTLNLASQLWQNRIILSAENPYPAVWERILKELGLTEVNVDDMPAWMMSPVGLMGLSGHWTNVPLHHGPTTNRAEAEPQPTTNTQ